MKTQRAFLWRFICATALVCVTQAGFTATYEQNLEKSFPATTGGKLVIQADMGTIQVKTDNSDQVQLTVLRKVKGGTKAQADELFADHEVTFSQEGNTVTVTAKRKTQKSWSWRSGRPNFEVRYLAHVPSKFDVDLRTAGGDVEVGALEGRASARTSSGTIKLDKITQEVEASNSGGDIFIAEAGGKLTAKTSSGSVNVQKAGGRAEISNSGGNIRLDEAGHDVVASTSSGSINLGAVKGNLKARNSGGDVAVKTVQGSADVETSSGTIRLGAIGGKELAARNSGGDIHVEKAGGEANVRTSSGSIDVVSAGGPITAKNSGGDISVGTAGSTVTAQTSSGVIKVKVAKGALELGNSGGDLVIGEAGANVAARTSSGSIRVAAVHGKVVAHNSGGDVKIGQAQGAVEAETSSGEISVAFTRVPKADCRLQVSGGGITATFPQNSSLNLDAHSSGGEVITELPVTVTVQGARNSGSLQGKINGGGPAIVLRASSGDIRLKKSAAAETPVEAEAPEEK